MSKRVNRLIESLASVEDGEPWPGDSLQAILADVTPATAAARPIAGANTIWGLVLHIAAWRRFAVEKLAGDESFDIELNSPADWPLIPEPSEESWQAAKNELKLANERLLEAIRAMRKRRLDKQVPGRKYTYDFLLHGLAQHDCYHAGQISLLKKAAAALGLA